MNHFYILRIELIEIHPELKSGMVVCGTGKPDADNLIQVCIPERPLELFRVAKRYLLPVSHYLRNQPCSNYWALIKNNDDDEFEYLQNPKTMAYGRRPFHFESLGEIVYFLISKSLISSHFTIARFASMPRLVSPNSKKFKHVARVKKLIECSQE